MSDYPRIYVADLAAYNAGELRGVWVDATDADEIQAAIDALLADSPYGGEEFAIHDYDGFGGLRLNEHESIETVVALGQGIYEHGEPYAAYVAMVGVDYATPADFEDRYQGNYGSVTVYAEELLEETGAMESVPEHLRPYIDCEAYGRDLVLGGDIAAVELPSGDVAIFTMTG